MDASTPTKSNSIVDGVKRCTEATRSWNLIDQPSSYWLAHICESHLFKLLKVPRVVFSGVMSREL